MSQQLIKSEVIVSEDNGIGLQINQRNPKTCINSWRLNDPQLNHERVLEETKKEKIGNPRIK